MPNSVETSNNNSSKIPKKLANNDLLPKYLPKAYPSTIKLYLMHFCYAFVSRMWDMGIVLLVATITNNSLFLVAMCGFLSSLFIFLFMPFVGAALDKMNRMLAVQTLLSAKIAFVSVAYLFCVYLSWDEVDKMSTVSKLFLYLIPLLCALVAVSFASITQSVEKDWIVVLSDGDSAWLTSTNAVMSQIDLGCASFAPVVTGFLFSYLSFGSVAAILLIANAIATISFFLFARGLYHSWTALATRIEKPPKVSQTNTTTTTNDDVSESFISKLLPFMSDFMNCGCAGVMISFSFLYLTVLSFGALMTVYLLWSGMDAGWIGVARGAASLSGFTGALLFPCVNSKLGLFRTAQFSIVYQCTLVVIAASSFFWSQKSTAVIVLVVAVLLSRTGLWMFDLAVRQIAQETIHESVRGKVNGQWSSMKSFFDMSAYALAVSSPNPQNFWMLTCISACMVFLATVTFTISNPVMGVNYCKTQTSHSDYQQIQMEEVKEESVNVEVEMGKARTLAYQSEE